MDKAVGHAYGEVGGSVERLLEALFADCQPQQFHGQCGPACGAPLLPMTAARSANLEFGLLRLAGSAVLVEEKYKGMRVQIHKIGEVIRFFGPDRKEIPASQNKTLFSTVRSSLQSDCILDAVLQRPVQPASRSASSRGAAKEVLWAFDCLCLNGKPLTRRSLRQRRQALAEVLKPHALFQASPCKQFEAEAPPTSEMLAEMLKEAVITRSEGLMLKCLESMYEAGSSSQAWMAVTQP
jgi:ATP-dependent DNA ligase